MKQLTYTMVLCVAALSMLCQVRTGDGLNELSPRNYNTDVPFPKIIKGQATYYNNRSVGITPENPVKSTASGDRFNENKMTAAVARSLYDKLVGKKVKVTNLKNHKTVTVTINDKLGKNPKHPRLIVDLTQAAAKKIDMIQDGRVEVTVEILE